MFDYPIIYKVENNVIIREKTIARNWCCITTKDDLGTYHSYNINHIDKNDNIFTHILLAYDFLKKKGIDLYED